MNKNEKAVPQLKELAKEAPVEIYPMLFNVVGIEDGSRKILLYTRAHYTKEEAIEAFRIKATASTGIPGSLWSIKVCSSISAEDLEKEFTIMRDQVQEEKKTKKNVLMKQILESKDLNLLHRHYGRFTNPEIEYMHEELLKK